MNLPTCPVILERDILPVPVNKYNGLSIKMSKNI